MKYDTPFQRQTAEKYFETRFKYIRQEIKEFESLYTDEYAYQVGAYCDDQLQYMLGCLTEIESVMAQMNVIINMVDNEIDGMEKHDDENRIFQCSCPIKPTQKEKTPVTKAKKDKS